MISRRRHCCWVFHAWHFEPHKLSAISSIRENWENADISTVNVSGAQQLLPKKSRWINSTTGKMQTSIHDFEANCLKIMDLGCENIKNIQRQLVCDTWLPRCSKSYIFCYRAEVSWYLFQDCETPQPFNSPHPTPPCTLKECTKLLRDLCRSYVFLWTRRRDMRLSGCPSSLQQVQHIASVFIYSLGCAILVCWMRAQGSMGLLLLFSFTFKWEYSIANIATLL